jgi:nucleotide-binding universal stress UspA family protein
MSNALINEALQENPREGTAPVSFGRILVALDQSDYANQAVEESIKLTLPVDGTITGIHAYAARMHDRRFKQMEGGLPNRYRYETEMEHQRDVHEDLIGKGLGIISDSYHDNAAVRCKKGGVKFDRLSPEGKNYRCILDAADTGEFDVLALGSRGLGAVAGSVIGSMCERVVRRSPIDTLVIKDRNLKIGDGPIVVGIDGSEQSFGVLKTALQIARQTGAKVHGLAAYDPYYHYVAFNKIADVLSDEAGKVFRFKEQEQLHEELIDDGIAKIYLSHLAIAKTVAEEEGVEIQTELVAGKPFQAIRKYLQEVGASLLMVGKVGIHADEGLDIGGNTENLLRVAPCHIWIGQATHYPSLDVIAEETIMWSEEAEAMISRAPDFVRGMARTAIIRQAHEDGHTFITSRFVKDVMEKMMPGANGKAGATPDEEKFEKLEWEGAATEILGWVKDVGVRENIRLRAEKYARRDAAVKVSRQHVEPFIEEDLDETLQQSEKPELEWAAAYLARLQRVPEAFRAKARETIENYVRSQGENRVDGDVGEGGFAEARKSMCPEPDAMEYPDGKHG